MSCPNIIALRCCSDPLVIIKPCSPTIDGKPWQSFIIGETYSDSNGVCWEAGDFTPVNYYNSVNDYYIEISCSDCQSKYSGDCSILNPISGESCYCINVVITDEDISNANGNMYGPDSTVIVNYIICDDSEVSMTYTHAGTYYLCGTLIDPPYYFANDSQTVGSSSATQTLNNCLTAEDCFIS